MTTHTRTAAATPTATTTASSLARDLAPICGVVFLEFLAMGLPLPVLPIHVHTSLGLGSFLVGLAIGAQSWATLFSRHAAGARSDRRGPRDATTLGLGLSALAGVTYALSAALPSTLASFAVLLAGRALLGIGESLVITGALSWGVGLAGRERSGAVMSWVGIAMYGALAVGAPLGTWLHEDHGFVGMSLAAALAPLAALALVPLAPAVAPVGGARISFNRVMGLIWLPGIGLALGALGFGAIAAFSTLRFGEAGWSRAALAMTAFGGAYVLARLALGRLPDRLGGARVALGSAAVAMVGQLGMWLATSAEAAIASAALTGLGFSLAFPSFGVEAMRRVPPHNRGVALGAYTACFDVTMGVGVPLLGAVAGGSGYSAAFAVGALGAVGSLVVAIALSAQSARSAS